MAETPTDGRTPRKPLRLWPGVILGVLLLLARFGIPAVVPDFAGFQLGMLSSFGVAAALLLWWLFFSRAAWLERLGAPVLMAGGLAAAWSLRDESMGPVWLVGLAVPVLLLAFVAWAAATRHLTDRLRRASLLATVLVACGVWTLLRMEGITGDHEFELAWRWTPTAEERLLAQAGPVPEALPPPEPPPEASATPDPSPAPADEPTAAPPAAVNDPTPAPSEPGATSSPVTPIPAASTPAPVERTAEWPGFRGPDRTGVVRGLAIGTDWSAVPPVELWRRPVGPGWSSIAVVGDLLFTQEQRGEHEVVAAYRVATGEPVWEHRDSVRFFEANAGAGPRATPTLAGRRVYALGATGIINALDAASGALVWSRDAAADTGAKLPVWGFSGSPLVVGDAVIVAASGRLVAYGADSGEPLWRGPEHGESYSSPQLVTIGGVDQVVLMSGAGATGVAPADGSVLWEHPWPGFPIVQPASVLDGGLLVSASQSAGTRHIALAGGPGAWTVEERWTSRNLKPYFNDFVVHEGHAYGFDGRILAAIGLDDGERRWKGGRYGSGQLVLLADQDLLLVLSEKGELALAEATPDGFNELARMPAIEGKTWNHPALAGDVVLVRNGQEMAAFRLPPADG